VNGVTVIHFDYFVVNVVGIGVVSQIVERFSV